MERNFKGIWIPKEIWLSEELTLQEKVMLVEIDSFDNEERGCYASNKYFSKFFSITPGRVSQIISSLISKGYVSAIYLRENQEIKERQLHINRPPYPEVVNILNTYLENDIGGSKYSKEGYLENDKENNITINNINNNINKENNKKKEPKHKYGEYQNVLLTEKEYYKLIDDFANADELIKFLDEYIEEKGYKSKSHNLAIRRWVVDAVKDKTIKRKDAKQYDRPAWLDMDL